ncbi:MAG: uroporphyrinogen-III C-methyltransferase [Pirellulaceae bacterium]|nr:uroporphyrinogen-III C-methyltransferase [Pirellulaceae bacterium]
MSTQDRAGGPTTVGTVYLVGAGPGDPGLITLRGAECLGRADVVLYDYLVNPQLLQLARAAAERICLGQHGRSRIWSQDEVHRTLVERARQGQCVVRLKGGDPAVFARGAEEAQVLADEGIPFEVVPGITAALAAGSYAGISVTHGRLASAVALVTGQERTDKTDSSLDFAALAAFPGTLVVYMGVTTVEHWSRELLDHGKPAETPVAVVRRCSLPDQSVVYCSLGEVARILTPASKMRPPVVVIIGPVATRNQALCWFERRPLFGQRVMVTRTAEQAPDLERQLTELGADVLVQPAIFVEPPGDWSRVDSYLDNLGSFDWLVFSSANGVRFLLDRLLARGLDLRHLAGVRLAAMGPGTASELARYHLQADLVPPQFRAESLADALRDEAPGRRFLLVRASRGREVLADGLQAAGGLVEQIVVYQSRDVTDPDPTVAERMRQGKVDWITVTSSAIARSLANLFGAQLRQVRLASISPITSGTLRELGFEPAAEAEEYTMAGLVEALRQAVESDQVDRAAASDRRSIVEPM